MSDDERHDDEEEIPKIGRGPIRNLFPMTSLVRIFALIVCLVAILALRTSCASGVAHFITGFSPPPVDAGPKTHTTTRP
jgi:hypothetical protein